MGADLLLSAASDGQLIEVNASNCKIWIHISLGQYRASCVFNLNILNILNIYIFRYHIVLIKHDDMVQSEDEH